MENSIDCKIGNFQAEGDVRRYNIPPTHFHHSNHNLVKSVDFCYNDVR